MLIPFDLKVLKTYLPFTESIHIHFIL